MVNVDIFVLQPKIKYQMKFTKEEARENLTTLLTNGGKKPLRMSERSLDGQLEDLMSLLDDDEMELDSFLGRVVKQFERINSNVEHDVSEAIKAIKPEQKPDDATAQLLQRIEALENEREEALNAQKAENKRKELRTFLKSKEVNKEWLDNILDLMTVDSETDVESVGGAVLEKYNKMMAGIEVPTPGYPSGSGDNKSDFSDVSSLRMSQLAGGNVVA